MSKVFKAVGNAVTSVVKGVVKAVTNVVKAVVNVVSSVVNFVTQPFMGMLGGMPDAPSAGAEAERQQGVLVQRRGSVEQVPVVYGYRKVGGVVTFVETGSTNNKYLYVAYVFSEGLVEGLREVFINDWLLPTDQVGQLNAGQLVTVNSDKYKDLVQLRWYPGVYFSNPRSSTVGTQVKGDIFKDAPSFTTDMVYNGLAVLFARYEWKDTTDNSNPFGGSIPEVQVSMLGKRVASLLVDSTETQPYESNPVRYSTNPAEILLDYLRNPRYGKGLFNQDIDWDSWKRAARKCNQTVTYLRTDATVTGPILTCNFVVDTAQTIMANTKTLLMGFRAYMPYVQGKYKLRIEDAGDENDILSGAAVIYQTFTKDDIVSNVTYTGIDRGSKYNVVVVSYVDPDQKFSVQQVIYPETEEERQVYIDLDGGRENKLEATFPTLTNYAMAKDMARLLFNKSRRQETCSLTVTSKALELEPGDNIRIQSNILNFGTDPWRIVSFKVNDDMTVDLNCVRNPDDIYPHVRVGEEDIVLPTFIPRGSIIYFPTSDNRIPLGLVPPTFAVFPPSTAPTTTNPLPTNPSAPAGGGVGGGSTNSGPTGTTTTPVSNTNVTPAPAPPPPDFGAVLKLKRVDSIDQGNQTTVFNIVFTQPNDALYQRSLFYWRLNRFSAWTTISVDVRPGAGQDIVVTIPGLPSTQFTAYEFYVRSFASDNRASVNVTRGTFGNVQNQSTGAIVGSGSSIQLGVTQGWAPPASDIPTEPKYDDVIDYFAIQPKLPSDPRRLQVKIQQIQNTIANSLNPLIIGFSVFYRFRGDTYWSREKFVYPGGYTFGLLTFDLAGDFGARGTLGALQQYEFFVRLDYADNKPSLKYLPPRSAPVEVNGTGLTNYDIYGTSAYSAAQATSQDIPGTFTYLTTDQNPNNTFAVGSDIVPAVQIIPVLTNNTLLFRFSPPVNNRFRGYKIRWREVTAGLNPTFNIQDVGARATNTAGTIEQSIGSPNYSHGRQYEWAITAQYYDSVSETVKDATQSLFARATVPVSDSTWSGIDVYNRMFTGTQPISTELALNNIRTSFPALPTVNPRSWVKRQNLRFSPSSIDFGLGQLGADVYFAGSGFYYLNSYYRLQFQSDSGSDNLVVYRRVYDAVGIQKNIINTTAKYIGLGPWEKVVIPLSNLPANSDGWRTVNVRGPINQTVFDTYYQVSGFPTRTLYQSQFGPSGTFPFVGARPNTTNIFPYYGVGNNAVGTSRYAEFIFVLATGSTEQTRGLRVTEFFAPNSDSTTFRTEVDGFLLGNVRKDDVVTLADFNNIEAGYGRRLSEAVTGLTLSNLSRGSTAYGGVGVPQYPTSNTSAYTHFLRQPTDGVTVY